MISRFRWAPAAIVAVCVLPISLSGCAGGATSGGVAVAPLPPATGTMSPGSDIPDGRNLLKNAAFEEGVLSPWTTMFTPPAEGTAGVVNGRACFDVKQRGKQAFDVLLRQRPVALRRHHQYGFKFSAESTQPARIRIEVATVSTPPRTLWSAMVSAGPKSTAFVGSFKPVDAIDTDVELVVQLGGALAASQPFTVCLDDFALRDPELPALPSAQSDLPKVRVNQTGYVPRLIKVATYKTTDQQPQDWWLTDASGKQVAKGKTRPFGADESAGELVQQIDFSEYRVPGRDYVLHVGQDQSDPFDIRTDLYHQLKYDALGFFYQQRSGIEIAMPYAGQEQWTRPAAHLSDKKVPCEKGSGCSYFLDVSGGWYDAGDQGKYAVNANITVWTLLNWYERTAAFGTSLRDFADGKLQIPEQHNGQPDLLDEVAWELDLLMRMQVPKGNPLAGMIHHKMHDQAWTPIPTAPQDDKEQRFLKPPSTTATLGFAAVGAQCARVYAKTNPRFAKRCLTAAEAAYQAAQRHPDLAANTDDKEGGGPYGDPDPSDELYWASAELFITTGRPEYLATMRQSQYYLRVPTMAGGGMCSMAWANTSGLGTISLAVAKSGLNSAEVEAARGEVVRAAQRYLKASNSTGYRVPFEPTGGKYPWGSNSFVLNNGVVLGLAYDFTKTPAYLIGAEDAMDYLLGRNPLAESYVTGYGERAVHNPHHRFWAHQADPAFPPPPPGVVSGGPNSGIEDPKAQEVGLGGCAPEKCFVDDIESWSTNEVAINWNAPLVWLASFLDEQAKGP